MSEIACPEVPELFFRALAVWAGVYGVGAERIEKLKQDGCDPDQVQRVVNALGDVFKLCEDLDDGN